MTRINPQTATFTFVAPGTPTLADCIVCIEAETGLTPTRRRDLASGLRRLAAALRLDPALIPAELRWLQPRIAAIVPAALGLTDKRWGTIVSDAKAGLALCGCAQRRKSPVAISEAWSGIWQTLLDSHYATLSPGLGRFVQFLDRSGVQPDEVGDAHIVAFQEAITAEALRKDPAETALQAIYAWNRAQRLVLGWPQQRLTPPRSAFRYALPVSAFLPSFQGELFSFEDRMRCPDPLDPTALVAPLRPATVTHRTGQVRRFASALVHAGLPITEITGLATLIHPANARLGLRWLLDRNGGGSNPGIAGIGEMLAVLAKHHVRPPATHGTATNEETEAFEQEAKALMALTARVAVRPVKGMTEKNRRRLRQIDDDAKLTALLDLPDHLWQEGLRMVRTPKKALPLFELAIAIGLLPYCPVRVQNLSRINLDINLQPFASGRAYLTLAPDELKNLHPMEFDIPDHIHGWIKDFLRKRAGVLCPAGSPWLFSLRKRHSPINGRKSEQKDFQRDPPPHRAGVQPASLPASCRQTGAQGSPRAIRDCPAHSGAFRHVLHTECLCRV
jgi:hypothetical protein